MEGVTAWQEAGGAFRHIGMLGLGRARNKWIHRAKCKRRLGYETFLSGVGASSMPLSVP